MAGIGLIPTLAPLPAGSPSPEMIDLQRKYAAALLADRQPIAAPSQGIEAILEGIIGARGLRRADAADAAANADAGKASAAMIAALMGPSAPASPGSPAIPKGGMTGWRPGPETPAVPPTPATGTYALSPDMVSSFVGNPRIDSGLKSALLGKMLEKPYAGFSGDVGPDHVIYKDGKIVATGVSKESEPLALEKYAALLGLKPGTPEFNKFIADKAGGGITINNVDNADKVARVKAMTDHFQKIADDASEADSMYGAVSQLDALLKDVTPGTDAAMTNWVRQNTGIELDPKNSGKLQAVQSLVDYLTPRMRVAGTGASSDRDTALFRGSLPSLLGTPEGNQIVVDTLKAMAARRVARAQLAEDFLANPDADAKSTLDGLRKLPDPLSEFKKSKFYIPEAGAPPVAGDAAPSPDGWVEIAPGVRYRLKVAP